MATIDVLGEEVDEPPRDARHRARLPRRLRGDRAGAPGLERQRQADRARAQPRLRALPREPRARSSATRPRAATSSGSTWRTRRRPGHARAVPRAPRGRARQRRHRPPGRTCAARSATSATLAPLQPNVRLVQGHLRRAAADRLPGLRGGARELRPLPARAAPGRLVRRRSRPTTSSSAHGGQAARRGATG